MLCSINVERKIDYSKVYKFFTMNKMLHMYIHTRIKLSNKYLLMHKNWRKYGAVARHAFFPILSLMTNIKYRTLLRYVQLSCTTSKAVADGPLASVGRYHFITSSTRYDKFRTVFSISRYLIKQNCTKKIV